MALGSVLALASAGGTAYAVTGRCARDGSCRDIRFEHSPVSHDGWISSPMPFARAVPNFDLAARGNNVWLFGGSSAGRYRLTDVLARSSDAGRTFVTGSNPCYAELAAELEPSSNRVVWAFCPTGLLGIAWRSTDGGATFKPLRIPHCCANSAVLAPATASVAVASANGAGTRLLRTTDGGVAWHRARTPPDINDWVTIQFVDPRVGFALVSLGESGTLKPLRTTDAGASWHLLPIR